MYCVSQPNNHYLIKRKCMMFNKNANTSTNILFYLTFGKKK